MNCSGATIDAEDPDGTVPCYIEASAPDVMVVSETLVALQSIIQPMNQRGPWKHLI